MPGHYHPQGPIQIALRCQDTCQGGRWRGWLSRQKPPKTDVTMENPTMNEDVSQMKKLLLMFWIAMFVFFWGVSDNPETCYPRMMEWFPFESIAWHDVCLRVISFIIVGGELFPLDWSRLGFHHFHRSCLGRGLEYVCFNLSRWWFQTFFCFHPYLGKIPILTNIFQMGWNHQPVILEENLVVKKWHLPWKKAQATSSPFSREDGCFQKHRTTLDQSKLMRILIPHCQLPLGFQS